MGGECNHYFAIPVPLSDYSRSTIVVSLVFWPARLRRLSCLRHRWRKKWIKFASDKTSRGLCPKSDRKACMYCWAGQNGRCQMVMSQPPSLCFVQPNDLSRLCNCFINALRTHSFTRFVTSQLQCVQKIKLNGKTSCCHFAYSFCFAFLCAFVELHQ